MFKAKTPRRNVRATREPRTPKEPRVFVCFHCGYATKLKSNLKKHIYNIHIAKRGEPRAKHFTCPMCDFVAVRVKMIRHYSLDHQVPLMPVNYHFTSFEDFKSWKIKMQKEEMALYVVLKGVSKLKSCLVRYYRCHRDGFFNSKGTGKRNVKLKGTNKINGCCPSEMKVIEDKSSGHVQVHFIQSHFGHDQELDRLPLLKEDKDLIAEKLAMKLPLKAVLDELHNSRTEEQKLERIHIVTRKDVLNIRSSYNLKPEYVKREIDGVRVDMEAWVKQTEQETNSIRFYKPQGEVLPNYPQLKKVDFVLIIYNDSQLEFLKSYGRDCVCFDRTQIRYQHDYELTTVFVVDESPQCFPCAFLLSNRTDIEVLTIFTSFLVQSIGCPLQCDVFMSDVPVMYYNAWCSVMPPPMCRLLCSWHVDQAWRKCLNKIKNVEKRSHALKIVRNLVQEKDRDMFERSIRHAIVDLKMDPEIFPFGQYFENEYSHNYTCWAHCFRVNSVISHNTHLESMHKTIKTTISQGKKQKKLDKSLEEIMKLVKEKLFDRMIVSHKGHLPPSLMYLTKFHESFMISYGMDLNFERIENVFKVYSTSSSELHEVTPHTLTCTCHLRCDSCGICIHAYRCNCVVYNVEWNICRHIHFVASKLPSNIDSQVQIEIQPNEQPTQIQFAEQPPSGDEEDRSMEVLHICESNVARELEDLFLNQFTKPKETDADLRQAKNDALKLVEDIFEAVETRSQLEVFTNAILPVLPTITAMKYSGSCNYK